jgi:flagellar protein FliO/FliZ
MKKITVLLFCIISLGLSINALSIESTQEMPKKTDSLFEKKSLTKNPKKSPPKSLNPQSDSHAVLSNSEPGSNIIQVTLGLFVVLMIIIGLAWFARRFGNFKSAAYGDLKIIGGLHMGAREKIVLVQVGGKQLLLGVAPGSIRTLHELETPLTDKEEDDHQPPRFSDRLASILNRSNNP